MSNNISPLRHELPDSQQHEMMPYILNRNIPEKDLRLRYMKLRFHLYPPQRYDLPTEPLTLTSEQELDDLISTLRTTGYCLEKTEEQRYGNRHHSYGHRELLSAELEGFTLHFHAYRDILTVSKARSFGHRFILTTPAGDRWECRKNRNIPVFIKNCMRNWQSWEQAWQRYLADIRKLRKMDEVGSISLQCILDKAVENIGWKCHQSPGTGYTNLVAIRDKRLHMCLRIEHNSNMAEFSNLPELLRDITIALDALGDVGAEYHSSFFYTL